jgi:hypothetical protein
MLHHARPALQALAFRGLLVISMASAAACAAAGADETPKPTADPAPAAESPGASPRTQPQLDRLLRPRDLVVVPAEGSVRGGRDREAWREQFQALRDEIETLEGAIAIKQQKLREASEGGYQFAPPGGGTPTDPEVLRWRVELKRDRTSLEASRRRLRELEIEASLAGVPSSWIE